MIPQPLGACHGPNRQKRRQDCRVSRDSCAIVCLFAFPSACLPLPSCLYLATRLDLGDDKAEHFAPCLANRARTACAGIARCSFGVLKKVGLVRVRW